MSKKRKKNKPGVCATRVPKDYLVTPPRTLSGGSLRKLVKEYRVNHFCLNFYKDKQMLSEFNYFNGGLHGFDAWFHTLGFSQQEFQEIAELITDETIASEGLAKIKELAENKQKQIKKMREEAPRVFIPGVGDKRKFEFEKIAFDRKLGGAHG